MSNNYDSQKVTITDINMSFGSMVVFMIKWALAAIPALIVLTIIFTVLTALLGGVLTSFLYNF